MIELLTDLLMLTGYLKNNDIDYLIFNGTPDEKYQKEHLLNTFLSVINKDEYVFDLLNFSFTEWCISQGYVPIDKKSTPTIGHPTLDAHEAFGTMLLDVFQTHNKG
jgi:hypothetical protein